MSPTEQRETIEAWAAAHGATIDEDDYYEELDVSGRTTDRKDLQAAVERALSGEVEGIVVARVDRFARNLVAGLTAVAQLREAGSTFVAVKDGIDGEHASTPTGRMLLGILFLFAQWQLESITEQWHSARERAVAKGVHTVEPFGYRKDEDRHLKPEPTEGPWVERIFKARAEGDSWSAIADMLNEAGVKPRASRRFTHARLREIVSNRTYLGEVRSGELVNPKAHPPLVTAAQWTAANGRRATAARRNREPFLLAGLIRCASCGVRMTGAATHRELMSGPVTYRVYRCRYSHSFGHCP